MLPIILSILLCAAASQGALKRQRIGIFLGVSETHKISWAISEVVKNPEIKHKYEFYYYTNKDLERGRIDLRKISESKIILVDIMHRGLTDLINKNADFDKTSVYGLRQKRGKGKIIYDTEVRKYFRPSVKENLRNLLLYLLNRDCKLDVAYKKPLSMPEVGIFHPKSRKIFSNFDEYLSWYKESGLFKPNGFWLGLPDYSAHAFPGETGKIVSSIIDKLESASVNVIPVYSFPAHLSVERFFFDSSGKARINLIAALSFKFASTADNRAMEILHRLNVPVLSPIRLSYNSIDEWKESPQGLGQMSISRTVCRPEYNGIIEPTVIGGRQLIDDKGNMGDAYEYQPIEKNIAFLVERIKAWRNLQTKKNRDKRIAIIYYNHSSGKHDVGASYLNIFKSLEVMLKRMKKEGYSIKGELPSENRIKELVLKSGRNIGSWAPGELDDLIGSGGVIEIPISQYMKWYSSMDENYRKSVDKEWGKVEKSKIMIRHSKIIIPNVDLGNIILLPQPSRGWGDDPMKLYHSTELYPHHQYTAFYLYLKYGFKADAVIHLGRHGTHEWLPGKQTGLSLSCPPEALIQDLPNIYPYIVDGIGEGIQAKRRGRAVIIDHLIPPMKSGGVYEEYGELSSLIDEYNRVISRDMNLAQVKRKRIAKIIKEIGIDKDLELKTIDDEAIEAIEHYLLELKRSIIPYGLHTFGISPDGDGLEEFSRLISKRNQDLAIGEIRDKLSLCGIAEMDALINALKGGYIKAGQGNDPVRNYEALPSGKNFYGFDPEKIPSKDAYLLGKKQAMDMIKKYQKENGAYPDKIGFVLWACETQRNEGINESAILYLLGMKPRWDKNNKIRGVASISGKKLGRPRIDVHIQASGLYRDSFPNLILLLDEAVRQAGKLTDVDNFIARHSSKIKRHLQSKGYSRDQAELLSAIRIFSAKPGSYGTKVSEIVPSSGLWEHDDDIADIYIDMVSFGYSRDIWGKPLEGVYKKNLEDIRVTVHSRSSNVYGLMDNDDVFQYLGGLSMAVNRVSNNYPDVLISRQQERESVYIEDIEKTLGNELRSRYLNPKWIEGMKKENYAGAREMADFLENMWGFQVTVPFAVDEEKWREVFEVYVEDKYNLDIEEFFNEQNPWALQSMNARMLEAVRKDYWNASEDIKKRLSKDYAMSVIEKGLACCDHTCNNPALNQMVVNIISMYGLLTPELINEFKAVFSKAASKSLEEAVRERNELLEKLAGKKVEKTQSIKNDTEYIEGYEMIEEKREDTKITSSGSSWAVIIIVLCIIGLFGYGWMRKR